MANHTTPTRIYKLQWRRACAGEYLEAALRPWAWVEAHNFHKMAGTRLGLLRCAVDSLLKDRW